MLRPLPALKDFVYLANSPESAATFRGIVPLSHIEEGITSDRPCDLPRITSLNICISEGESWMIKQVLEVMFQGCDLRELQTLSLSSPEDIPPEYCDRLLQYLLLYGHHLKSICLDIEDENTSALLAAICKYCISLEGNTGN